ncbi:MAG: hypothetical protein SO013_08575, partial [Prevotella sp.]|nr:hypothetical protein [Prevotella sp.]
MLNKQQRKYQRQHPDTPPVEKEKLKDGVTEHSSAHEKALESYVLACSDEEGDYLHRLYRATNIHTVHGRMASGHLQGRLLRMFVKMVNPTNILEVGTFSGYSAICLAEGLTEGGKVWTFEINDEQEDFTRPWIEQSPVGDKINFIIGNAIEEA